VFSRTTEVSLPRRVVVPLLVVALCSCGAGQSERLMREVELSIQEVCRASHAGPAERRECVAMLWRASKPGIEAGYALVDGENTLPDHAVDGPAPASPGEWLLTRPLPSVVAMIGTVLLGVYIVYSWFPTPRRWRSDRPRAPYQADGQGYPRAGDSHGKGGATADRGVAGGPGGGE